MTVVYSMLKQWFNGLCTNTLELETRPDDIEIEVGALTAADKCKACVSPTEKTIPGCRKCASYDDGDRYIETTGQSATGVPMHISFELDGPIGGVVAPTHASGVYGPLHRNSAAYEWFMFQNVLDPSTIPTSGTLSHWRSFYKLYGDLWDLGYKLSSSLKSRKEQEEFYRTRNIGTGVECDWSLCNMTTYFQAYGLPTGWSFSGVAGDWPKATCADAVVRLDSNGIPFYTWDVSTRNPLFSNVGGSKNYLSSFTEYVCTGENGSFKNDWESFVWPEDIATVTWTKGGSSFFNGENALPKASTPAVLNNRTTTPMLASTYDLMEALGVALPKYLGQGDSSYDNGFRTTYWWDRGLGGPDLGRTPRRFNDTFCTTQFESSTYVLTNHALVSGYRWSFQMEDFLPFQLFADGGQQKLLPDDGTPFRQGALVLYAVGIYDTQFWYHQIKTGWYSGFVWGNRPDGFVGPCNASQPVSSLESTQVSFPVCTFFVAPGPGILFGHPPVEAYRATGLNIQVKMFDVTSDSPEISFGVSGCCNGQPLAPNSYFPVVTGVRSAVDPFPSPKPAVDATYLHNDWWPGVELNKDCSFYFANRGNGNFDVLSPNHLTPQEIADRQAIMASDGVIPFPNSIRGVSVNRAIAAWRVKRSTAHCDEKSFELELVWTDPGVNASPGKLGRWPTVFPKSGRIEFGASDG